ncbi:MAG: hypothetical protein GQ527_06730 [Bacteroidales bacterium]|nr:hypothetical protein [Bacteroidales bacterium]
MKADIIQLSKLAAKLVQQKEKLKPQEYQGQLEIIVESLADISNKNNTETQLKDVDLIEKMSFEIRTPMNSILGFTGLLKDSYFSRQEKEEFIDLIEKNTEHLVQLLNDLTDLTKVESSQINLRIKEFELNVFMLNFIADFQQRAKEKNITIDKVPSNKIQDNICLSTDPYQLRHILDNLILNIIAFSENNHILLKTYIEDDNFLIIKILSENIELPETLSRSIKKHISYSLKETNFDGSGLRLTLTKALVDLLKGEIDFKCIPNQGSEFTIKIPITNCKMK